MIVAEMRVVFNRLPQGAALLRSGIPQAVTKAASDGADRARGYVPVDTGELQGSIASRSTGSTSAEFTAGTDHGLYQEFGTSRQAGTPFMRPAAEAIRPGFEAAMRELIGRIA